MKKYNITASSIVYYTLEIEAENYDVVHAEEFINQVDELEDKHHPDCPAFDNFGCRCEELNKETV
jgi:hypothetical protein